MASKGAKSEKPTEIFEQNIKNEQLQRKLTRTGDCEDSFEEHDLCKKKPWYRRINKTQVCIALLILVQFLCLIYFMVVNVIYPNGRLDADPITSLLSGQSSHSRTESSILQKVFLNLGMRSDQNLQECQGPFLKKSFPDIDYALRGYNVLKGYPQAIGHDPGLTHPIFYADYSQERQTSDCRYSLPTGLFAVPDVSCVTSFKSEEIKTSFQFSKSLSAQANVQGGVWGVSFSVSAGYKQATSEMSTGQTVYVMSSASCKYYSTSLDLTAPPPFEAGFLRWSEKLIHASDEEIIEFINYYGTHYLKEVTFGAKYIYQHKMSSKSYKTLNSKEFSVSAQASYSGLFSVGGGFSLDSSQSQAASEFSKKVETTTIAVGAPPPSNGDAMTWASTVKDSPVPVYYSMASIEELFSPRFMSHISLDYEKVREKLEYIRESGKYCAALRNQGIVDSCKDFSAGYELKGTRLHGTYQHRETGEVTCIEDCLADKLCVAVLIPLESSNTCYFYSGNKVYAYKDDEWKAIIFQHKIQSASIDLKLNSVHIPHGQRGTSSPQNTSTLCKESCLADPVCDAFEFCNRKGWNSWCKSTTNNCHLFAMSDIKAIERRSHSAVKFIIRP